MSLTRLMSKALIGVSMIAISSIAGTAESTEQIVRDYVIAFSNHDIPVMLELAHPEIEWVYVQGSQAAVQTRGHADLQAAMETYYKTVPSAHAEIVSLIADGEIFAVQQKATWTDASGETTGMTSLSIYEVEDGKIRRVWVPTSSAQ